MEFGEKEERAWAEAALRSVIEIPTQRARIQPTTLRDSLVYPKAIETLQRANISMADMVARQLEDIETEEHRTELETPVGGEELMETYSSHPMEETDCVTGRQGKQELRAPFPEYGGPSTQRKSIWSSRTYG